MPAIDTSESRKRAGNFIASLFDFSFASFITLKLIRILYLLGILMAGLAALGVIVFAFNINSGFGLLALLLSPVVFLFVLIYARVSLELIAILFRIEENTARLPRQP